MCICSTSKLKLLRVLAEISAAVAKSIPSTVAMFKRGGIVAKISLVLRFALVS